MKTIKILNENTQINVSPIGSNLVDYLTEEGILEECLALSSKELKDIMKEEEITKQELANRMHTRRESIKRLLDKNNQSATLYTLEKANILLNNEKIKELSMATNKKSNTFDNAASKRRITVQVRGYDKNGDYKKEETITFKVKNTTLEEVWNSISNSLKKDFPSKKSDK